MHGTSYMGNLNWKVLLTVTSKLEILTLCTGLLIFDKQPGYEASGLVIEVIQCMRQLHRTVTQVLRYSIVTVVCMSHKAV